MPGAVLGCLGAALVILGGERARIAVLPLTARPVVGLGRISYSLYLWHWPVLVFAGYVLVRELRLLEGMAALGLSLVLALLSWRFVEQPARHRRGPPLRVAAFAESLMRAAGVDAEQVATVTENILWNDAAGRHNHGVERLPILLRRVQAQLIACPPACVFTDLGPSVARLEAGNAFGQHAGVLAADRAIALARNTGLGAVGVASSNFYGTGAFFVSRIAEQGMIGLVLSNSFPKVAAPGGVKAVLGTNPFAFGAPGPGGRRILVDMSTAAAAGSTIREASETRRPLPEGIAVDADGRAVTDPVAALSATLLPAAGAKGFGLALMVEILAGVLTGAGIGGGVGSLYKDFNRPANSGHFVLALDIARWMSREVWDERFGILAQALACGTDGKGRLPGEVRAAALAESEAKGIPVTATALAALNALAAELGVPGGVGATARRLHRCADVGLQ